MKVYAGVYKEVIYLIGENFVGYIEIPKNHNWYMQPINNYLIETKNYLDTPIVYKDKHYITFQMLNPANDNLDDVLAECKNIIEQLWRN